MSGGFSAKERIRYLEAMAARENELLIIGGGITGAGIALDAASRGLTVALIEMDDFASGTSSRSTKLIHGGLRYLKQREFKIVRETGRERSVVFENGPHVTRPEWMLLPFYEGGTLGPLTVSIGLTLYDRLAGVRAEERHQILKAEETVRKEPLLKRRGLKGAGYYVEYRTDDARLTLEVLKEAVKHGALSVNYAQAEGFLYHSGKKMAGARVRERMTGQVYEIRAKTVINATGPWADEVRFLDEKTAKRRLQLTKGVHLVFDGRDFPLRHAVYFEVPDGRMVFAIPRDGKTYVGTTDTIFEGEKREPGVTLADVDYLIDAVRFMFPETGITRKKVESSWSGVRPLIAEEGKGPSEISRKDEIWVSESGLLTIAGGKLTGYRKMAREVVDIVFQKLAGKTFVPCRTGNLPISGGDVGGADGFRSFLSNIGKEAAANGLNESEARQLAERYGSNARELFVYAKEASQKNQPSLPPTLYAMLKYAVEQEMAVRPVDFFIRRTGALYFQIDWVKKWKDPVLEWMKQEFGWNGTETDRYRGELEKAIAGAVPGVE